MLRSISLLTLLTFSSVAFAFADWCQLGERCDYFSNDIKIAPPYVGTYKCTLDPANLESVTLEVSLLTSNTIADPVPLVLNNDNKVGIIKVLPRSGHNFPDNAFRGIQTSTSFCDGRSGKDCDIKPTLMCERIEDN